MFKKRLTTFTVIALISLMVLVTTASAASLEGDLVSLTINVDTGYGGGSFVGDVVVGAGPEAQFEVIDKDISTYPYAETKVADVTVDLQGDQMFITLAQTADSTGPLRVDVVMDGIDPGSPLIGIDFSANPDVLSISSKYATTYLPVQDPAPYGGFLGWTDYNEDGFYQSFGINQPTTTFLFTYTFLVNEDVDGDGVNDNEDLCPGTSFAADVPEQSKKNRYYTHAFGEFVDGDGNLSGITVADTGGCSAMQIVEAAGLGGGHEKFGISMSALLDWIAALP